MTPPADRRSQSPEELKIQQSLKVCWKDGIAAQVMITIIDTYMVPFALLLGATNQQIGWLVAIPNLLASFSQAWAVSVVKPSESRLTVILKGVFAQAFFILPIGFLPFLPISGKLALLTGAFCIYKVIMGFLGPPWGSLVSEYLPPHRRGDYFGWRARAMGVTSIVTLIFWGLFLYFWNIAVTPESGFMVMFLISAAARFVSYYYIGKMYDLPQQKANDANFTLWMFLRRFRESNFVRYVFYVSGITFATHLAAPYFSVHMLRDLQFSYLEFMIVTLAAPLSGLVAFPIWGRHADVVGNARILKTTSIFLPMIPLFWLFLHTPLTLFLVECFAGVMWGGFNLCAVNYIYDAVVPAKRMRCIGYFNLFNGLAIFAGSLIGGWLSDRLIPLFGFPLLSLFVISSAGRFLAHFFLSSAFKEVRSEVRPVSSMKLFFSVVGLQPMIGRNTETQIAVPGSDFATKPRSNE